MEIRQLDVRFCLEIGQCPALVSKFISIVSKRMYPTVAILSALDLDCLI